MLEWSIAWIERAISGARPAGALVGVGLAVRERIPPALSTRRAANEKAARQEAPGIDPGIDRSRHTRPGSSAALLTVPRLRNSLGVLSVNFPCLVIPHAADNPDSRYHLPLALHYLCPKR